MHHTPKGRPIGLSGPGNKAPDRRSELIALGIILAIGLLLRLLLYPSPVHKADLLWFGQWTVGLLALPLDKFYAQVNPPCDYLPGYLYVLDITGRVAREFGASLTDPQAFGAWVKPVPIAADLALGVLVYFVARRYAGARRSLVAAAMVVLNPGVIVVSSAWGQVDSVGGVLAILSLAGLIAGNPWLAALFAGLAFTVKPQYLLFLGIAGIAYLRRDSAPIPHRSPAAANAAWARWIAFRVCMPILVLLATIQLIMVPFSVSIWPASYAQWNLAERLSVASDWFPFTSISAFNLWGTAIAGWRLPDSTLGWFALSYQQWGLVLLGATVGGAALLAWVRAATWSAVLFACYLAAFASFILPTRVQDRYLFICIPLLATATALWPRMSWYYAATSMLYLANVLWGYLMPVQALELAPSEAAAAVAVPSVFGVLLLVAGIANLLKLIAPNRSMEPELSRTKLPEGSRQQ